MRVVKGIVLIATLAIGTSGCVYTNVKIPRDTDLNETKIGSKTGTSELHSVLGLVAWGDAGTQAAAEEGGITVLQHADSQIFSILFGLYYNQKTIVYGE